MTWHNYKSGLMQNMIYQHLKQYDNSHTVYIYDGHNNKSSSTQIKEHSLFLYIVLTYSQQSSIHSGKHRKFSMTFNNDASVPSSLFDIYTEALDKNRSLYVANSGHRNTK